jgi:glycerol-3-phosphate dehydrogenase
LAELGRARSVDTYDLKIGGGRNLPVDARERAAWIRQCAGTAGLTEARFSTLVSRYGSRSEAVAAFMAEGDDAALASAPDYSRRELLFLIENERVREIGDILLRRTTLGIEGRINAELTSEIAALLGSTFGWSVEETSKAVARFNETIEHRHRIQH